MLKYIVYISLNLIGQIVQVILRHINDKES